MNQSIAKEYKAGGLLRFALPSIIMMIFVSLYTIVDGFFVSRYVGTDALSAVNLVYPVISIIIAIGVMLATGGNAVVAIRMGEGNLKKAKKDFTLITITAIISCTIFSTIVLIYMEPVVRLLGADASLVELCVTYLTPLMLLAPFSALQMLFQSFFITAGKPGLGLTLTITAGLCNMLFDYIFIVPMNMGIVGAAYATAIGYMVPAIGGLVLFMRKKEDRLCFAKPDFDKKVLFNSCTNGSSEMVTNLSGSITTLLFNIVMMKLAGSDGVASITVVLYSQFLMTSLFMGFSIGVAPVISYHYGAGNSGYLKKLNRICISFILGCSVLIFATAFFSSGFISGIFAPAGSAVALMAADGLKLFSVSFLFAGLNIFASALYTALSDGKTSAGISFSRTFIFTVSGILILSTLWGINGVWLAIPFAEAVTFIIVIIIVRKKAHSK